MAYTIKTDKTFAETKREVDAELGTWQHDCGKRITYTFEANVPASRQFSRNLSRAERAVTLIVNFADGRRIVWASEDQETVAANARLLRIAIERLRLIEKAGLAEMMRSALVQLAPPTEDAPWVVLGCSPHASAGEIEQAYRQAALKAHPDRGGSHDAMVRVNAARDVMLEAARASA